MSVVEVIRVIQILVSFLGFVELHYITNYFSDYNRYGYGSGAKTYNHEKTCRFGPPYDCNWGQHCYQGVCRNAMCNTVNQCNRNEECIKRKCYPQYQRVNQFKSVVNVMSRKKVNFKPKQFNDEIKKPQVVAPPVSKCSSNEKLDLVILLDESSSMGYHSFKKMIEFVEKFSSAFDLDGKRARIGVVPYSTTPSHTSFLNSVTTQLELNNYLNNLPYLRGKSATGDALNYVQQKMFQNSAGAGKNAAKLVLVITDGPTNYGLKPAQPAEELIKRFGAKIFAIGIKGASAAELNSIASDTRNVILLPDFETLKHQQGMLLASICKKLNDNYSK